MGCKSIDNKSSDQYLNEILSDESISGKYDYNWEPSNQYDASRENRALQNEGVNSTGVSITKAIDILKTQGAVVDSYLGLSDGVSYDVFGIKYPEDTLFDFGKYYLTDNGKTILTEFVDLLPRINENISLVLVGHTDSIGALDDNELLSYKRASEVSQYINNRLQKKINIRLVSMGERQPVATNNTPDGRKKNRRVEIFMSKNSKASLDVVQKFNVDYTNLDKEEVEVIISDRSLKVFEVNENNKIRFENTIKLVDVKKKYRFIAPTRKAYSPVRVRE